MSEQKCCRVCGTGLVVGENWAKSRQRYASYICSPCGSAVARARYVANPDKAKAQNRAWIKANREKRRAHLRRATRAYRARNPDKVRARSREMARVWRRANPDKVKARNRAWIKANPEKASALVAKRRARKAGAVTHIDAGRALQSIRWALAAFLGVPEKDIHLDHIVPLSRGGTHTDDNLRLLPARLNSVKGSKLDHEVEDAEFQNWVFGPPTFE